MKKSDIVFRFRHEDIQEFQSLMTELARVTGKSMEETAFRTSTLFTARARTSTPAEKGGEITTRNYQHKIIVEHSGGRRTARNATQEDVGWIIPEHGLGWARGGWVEAWRRLNQKAPGEWSGFGDAKQNKKRHHGITTVTGYRIENTVPYIEDLDRGSALTRPHRILEKAMTKAERQLIYRLTKMSRKMRSKWK